MAIILRGDKGFELTHDELDNNFVELRDNPSGIHLPKTQNTGIKVDTDAPDYPWVDMLGTIFIEAGNPNSAGFSTYRGGIKGYQFQPGLESHINFHLPHDYVMGSDIYLHAHWSHVSALVTGGSVTWGFEISYAPGHDRGAFSAPKTLLVPQNASLTQYQHLVAEGQASTPGGSATQLDTNLLEPDGIIQCRVYLQANNITSSGAVPDPFAHFADIHYQSTGVGTKQRQPDFWT